MLPVTEEAITTVDEGKLGMYKIHVIRSIMRQKSRFSFLLTVEVSMLPN